MLKKRFIIKLILLTAAIMLLAGCGEPAVSEYVDASSVVPDRIEEIPENTQSVEKVTGMLNNPSVDFEVPIMYPAIMVDRVGYRTTGDKQAIVIAESIPASFRIVDANTSETVFESNMKSTDYEVEGFLTAIADFSELEVTGEYYIETEILGCSMNFFISNSLYEDLLANTFNRLHSLRCTDVSTIPYESNTALYGSVSGGWYTSNQQERDVVEGCLGIIDLTMAYEYHSRSFSDKMNIDESRNKIPDILDEAKFEAEWLLKMQNAETGGVYNGIALRQAAGSSKKQLMIVGESSKATAYFCAALAHFSVVYNKYDSGFAKKCLKAATNAWICLQTNKDVVTEVQMYRAAVEMYNATGKDDYKTVIENYLAKNAGQVQDSRGLVDAAISYMSSPENTDVKACRKLMSAFLERTQNKTLLAKKSPYGIESVEVTPGELLRNADELVIVDYINTSKQYENNEIAYLHYLCGRNATSTIYVNEFTNPDDCAKLLVLLGRLMD